MSFLVKIIFLYFCLWWHVFFVLGCAACDLFLSCYVHLCIIVEDEVCHGKVCFEKFWGLGEKLLKKSLGIYCMALDPLFSNLVEEDSNIDMILKNAWCVYLIKEYQILFLRLCWRISCGSRLGFNVLQITSIENNIYIDRRGDIIPVTVLWGDWGKGLKSVYHHEETTVIFFGLKGSNYYEVITFHRFIVVC